MPEPAFEGRRRLALPLAALALLALAAVAAPLALTLAPAHLDRGLARAQAETCRTYRARGPWATSQAAVPALLVATPRPHESHPQALRRRCFSRAFPSG
jgi:hypothetical protein